MEWSQHCKVKSVHPISLLTVHLNHLANISCRQADVLIIVKQIVIHSPCHTQIILYKVLTVLFLVAASWLLWLATTVKIVDYRELEND